MAVPSTGELSLQGIRREFETDNYGASNTYTNISLEDLSRGQVDTINSNNSPNLPDESAPHLMSEFYGYDHDLASATTSFSSVFADFNLVTAPDTSAVDSAKSFAVNNGSGDLTVSVAGVSPSQGLLKLSLSSTGDPGTNGTGNSATGFISLTPSGGISGLTLSSISWGSSKTIHVRFKYEAHTANTSAATRTLTITNNSVSITPIVTIRTNDR